MTAPVDRPRPQVRDDLHLLPGYHSPQLDVEVRLNTNESPLPPPPAFFDGLATAVRSMEVHRYPDRRATALRAAIAELHGVDPAQVFCANGSNEVIQTLLLAYGGPGRAAAAFQPTYAMHEHIARQTATAVLTGQRDDDFRIDPDELASLAARAHVTFLCSPNNPTAVAESPENVRRALDATEGIVAVDEAYGQFASWTAQQYLDEDVPLVVLRTFSKTWAMAGMRLGYLLGPSWLVEQLWEVSLPYHLSQQTQAAGLLALQFEDEMHQRVDHLVRERQRMLAALADLPVRTWPSEANFILLRPQGISGDEVWQRLVDRSVLVRNCSSWPRLADCLRVTVGTLEEDDRFLDALREVLP